MKINLNQTLASLGNAYHAGKLTKEEYRIQRSIELDGLSEQVEKSSGHFNKKRKHITISVVLFIVVSFIFLAAFF